MKKILFTLLITLLVGCNDYKNSLTKLSPTVCYKATVKTPMIETICLNSLERTAKVNNKLIANYKKQGNIFSIEFDGMASIFNSFANYKFSGKCFHHVDNDNLKYCPI